MRILYLDPTNFPPAALDDATTLKLRRYILGSSTLVIGGCFFVEAFKLATEQERLDIAECANRHIIFDPSGDTVKVSAHPGDTVIVDGQYLGDGEKRDLFHCSRITLALTASLEISHVLTDTMLEMLMRRARYDFYESPRAVTSPVESTGSNPNMVQAPAKPAPIEVATPTIAVPQERTSPLVPKIFATPAPKQAVPMAKDSSLPKTSTTLAFHDSRFPDPVPSSAPNELPHLFDGGNNNDDDDHRDDQQEAQLAPVADVPPRSHRMPGLGSSMPVTGNEPSRWVSQTISVPKQRRIAHAPAPPHRSTTQNGRKVASRTRSVSVLDLPTSPPRRSKAPRSTS